MNHFSDRNYTSDYQECFPLALAAAGEEKAWKRETAEAREQA